MDPSWERPRLRPNGERVWRIDERCAQYEREWTAGGAPRIETYLDGVEGQVRTVLWLELVMLDQTLRRGRGEETTLADYQVHCPDPSILLELSTAGLSSVVPPGATAQPPPPAAGRGPRLGLAGADRIGGATAPLPSNGNGGESGGDLLLTRAAAPDEPTGPFSLARDDDATEPGALAGSDDLAARSGSRLGDYELIAKLAEGGMGVVLKARQLSLNRLVALKMIKTGTAADERAIRLFRSEAEAVAALDHPRIVPILESGQCDGLLYYSMKLIEGRDLQKCLNEFKDQPRAIARLMARVAEAIDHAHRRGVLHRDLKPSNILVDPQGEPHVIDFGLAYRLGAVAGPGAAESRRAGTPSYMAPEQVRGETTTASDIYGLGAILYALLTGRPPFAGDSVERVLHRISTEAPPRPGERNPRVDRDLEIICLKCLEKDPARRYASAGELADDLNRWLDSRPIRARPASAAERLVKWARRRPAIAALTATVVLVSILGVGGITWGWQQAVAAGEREREARLVAQRHEAEALKSEELACHLAYAAKLNLAERDWRDANVGQVRRHLNETRPLQGKTDLRGFEWYYLDRLCRAHGRTLAGHWWLVWSVAYSPDGRRLASASWDGTVRLWDAATGQPIRTLLGGQQIFAVVFHPDGTRLASAGKDTVITLWDASTGQPIRTFPGHTGPIHELAISPDGRILASSSLDGTIKLWDLATGAPVRTIQDHRTGEAAPIRFSPDGKTLAAAGGGEPSVRLRDVATGAIRLTLKDEGMGPFPSLAFSPDGQILASGGGDGTIQLRDAVTGSHLRAFRDDRDRDSVRSLAFSPDGRILASANYVGQAINLWDAATGHLLRTLKGHTGSIHDIAFSPNGVHLASAGGDGTVKIWDATRDQEARSLVGKDVIARVAFGPDGSFLAAAGKDRAVTLWDLATGQAIRAFQGHTDDVCGVAISREGRRAASAGLDKVVRVWDVATGRQIHALEGHRGTIWAVAFSPDGKTLASASEDRTVTLWAADTGRKIRTLEGHSAAVTSVAFSPDGKTLASASNDGFVRFWELGSGRPLQAIRAHPGGVTTIALSPDGRWLASAGHDSYDPLIKLWDVATGQAVHELKGHAGTVRGLAFSPDGRRLAAACSDRTVRIWDPAFGQEVMVLRGHAGPVWGVAFSPDGARLASASNDHTIKIWEANTSPGLPKDP